MIYSDVFGCQLDEELNCDGWSSSFRITMETCLSNIPLCEGCFQEGLTEEGR